MTREERSKKKEIGSMQDVAISIQPSPEEKEDFWTRMSKNDTLMRALGKKPPLEKPQPPREKSNPILRRGALKVPLIEIVGDMYPPYFNVSEWSWAVQESSKKISQTGTGAVQFPTFDYCLQKVLSAGYQGFPFPNEIFSLRIEQIERTTGSTGFFEDVHQVIAEDIRKQNGEWCDIAGRFEGEDFVIYQKPKNVSYKDSHHFVDHQRYTTNFNELLRRDTVYGTVRFNRMAQFKNCDRVVPIIVPPNEFIEFLFSKTFNNLPEVFQRNASILFPPEPIIEDEIFPCHIEKYNVRFDRCAGAPYRGVVRR